MTKPKDEVVDAPTGIDDVDVSDLLTDGFRAAVYEALPLADPRQREKAFDKVVVMVRWYRGFLVNERFNLSSKEIREHLQRGLDLARNLEKWIADIPPIVWDYVLSGVEREANKQGNTITPEYRPDWDKRLGALRCGIDDAMQLVVSDRGRPENVELNDLVWSLALVWEEYANCPFGLTKKGVCTPYEFVRMVCRAADPGMTPADLGRQLATALRLAMQRLKRRRAERGRK